MVHFMPDTTVSLAVSLEWLSLFAELLHTFPSNHIAYPLLSTHVSLMNVKVLDDNCSSEKIKKGCGNQNLSHIYLKDLRKHLL